MRSPLLERRGLGLSIVLVPLFAEADYMERVMLGIAALMRRRPVVRLAFGDLHLEHIREWRESVIGQRGRRVSEGTQDHAGVVASGPTPMEVS